MQYLSAAEYVTFGLGEDTADELVVAASAMIDAFCRRTSLAVMQYVERMRLRRGCEAQLSFLPIAPLNGAASALVSVRVRLGRAVAGVPMAEALCAFGLAGQWVDVDVSTVTVSEDGVFTLLPHLLGVPYLEAEVTYTSGYVDVPVPVKIACAQIVKNAQAMPALNVKRQALDGMQMEYFQGALLDAEVQRLLQPYVAERVG
ncbi:hypothetical protein [Terriglobus sp. TAA 43]|uniref:hypothetical protein n=1 Tax=Terriglobus sp. TAA 43 TaxID=278961 RepID=UPI000645B37E|nr:hypothetical protein [Terriglobus sp. TAA 43]